MLHQACEFIFEHKYLTVVVFMLFVSSAFVQTGKADVEASAASWQSAHDARMSIVD